MNTYGNEERTCCICGCKFRGWGNNPWPVVQDVDARCCDLCNDTKVLSARITQMYVNSRKESK